MEVNNPRWMRRLMQRAEESFLEIRDNDIDYWGDKDGSKE